MELLRHAESQTYPAGTVLFRQGDPGEHFYAIQSGRVELRAGEVVLSTLGEGEVFGEMALVDASPRSATAIVKEEARIAAIDRKRFLFLVQNTPFFSLPVMHVMANRLRGMEARLSGMSDAPA